MNIPPSNATTSNPPFLWVDAPKQRDTLGILSFCLSTMTICVWSTLHFGIPATRHSPTHRFCLGVLWMLIALVAPEGLLCAAIHERIDAGVLVEQSMEYLPSREFAKPRILARAYNYVLGRPKWEVEYYKLIERASRLRTSRLRKHRFGLVHAFYATMGGFVFDTSNDETVSAEKSASSPSNNTRRTRYIATPSAFIYIMKYFPHIIPDISEESITDRAESSSLSKALLIIQVGWFCTNCASRLIQHLPLSLLEVSTAAHSFCTLLTYFVWWSKPLNVAEGITTRGKEAREVHALLMCTKREYSEALRMAQRMVAGDPPTTTHRNEQERIFLAANALKSLLPILEEPPEDPFTNSLGSAPGSFTPRALPNQYNGWISMAASPIVYGLIHFLGWGVKFPTAPERVLWRVSSVVVMCSGLVLALLAFIGNAYSKKLEKDRAVIIRVILAILMLLLIPLTYVLASGFLIGESFRQLFFLDPAAYQLPSWSNYWPHLS